MLENIDELQQVLKQFWNNFSLHVTTASDEGEGVMTGNWTHAEFDAHIVTLPRNTTQLSRDYTTAMLSFQKTFLWKFSGNSQVSEKCGTRVDH